MISLARFLALSFLMFALAGQAVADGLDGLWEGVLTVAPDSSAPTARETFSLRVELSGTGAKVWFKPAGNNDWMAVPRDFSVQRLRGNAVVTSIMSGRDDEGIWVETWSIALAQRSNDKALAVYARLVNNENLPETSDHKAFSMAAEGELAHVRR